VLTRFLSVTDDWGLSLQVCLDILRSDGVPGLDHSSDTQVVRLFSGNPDLDYGAVHSLPRITLGAFRRCLETLFLDTTGRNLEAEFFGKPYPQIVRVLIETCRPSRCLTNVLVVQICGKGAPKAHPSSH